MKTIEKQKRYTTYDLVEAGQFFFPCSTSEYCGYVENLYTPMIKSNLDNLSVELKTGNVSQLDNKTMCLITNYSLVEG